MLRQWCLMEREWSCYGGGQFNGGTGGHVSEAASLIEFNRV